MIGLFIPLFLLGLAAIDPIGIAAMPILLIQKRPYLRSFIFLSGSFTALMLMGFVFSKGLGRIILHVEQTYVWIIPTLESIAGIALLIIATYLMCKKGYKDNGSELSSPMIKRLHLGNGGLFMFGALLVTVQSIIDVVFLIAMIKVGEQRLSFTQLSVGIFIYATAAILLQMIVIVVYRLTPLYRRKGIIQAIHRLLARYASRFIIVFSVVFGIGLILNSMLTVMGYRLF